MDGRKEQGWIIYSQTLLTATRDRKSWRPIIYNLNRARHLNDDGDALVKLLKINELYDEVLQCTGLAQLLIGLNFALPFTNCNEFLQSVGVEDTFSRVANLG